MKNTVILWGVLIATSVAGVSAMATVTRPAFKSEAWSVFTASAPKECWAVSTPAKTINTRAGKEAQVERGDILLFVTQRPGQKRGEVSFMGGYPFARGSTVSMVLNSGEKFTLMTSGEVAWSRSAKQDATIIEALKDAGSAVLTGQSSRGTTTFDRFSLMGITAAIEKSRALCGLDA